LEDSLDNILMKNRATKQVSWAMPEIVCMSHEELHKTRTNEKMKSGVDIDRSAPFSCSDSELSARHRVLHEALKVKKASGRYED